MRILIIHHVEPHWEEGFDKDEILAKINSHLATHAYDKIILSMQTPSDPAYPELLEKGCVIEEWLLGFCAYDDPDWHDFYISHGMSPDDLIMAARMNDWVYLYPWIKQLAGNEIHIAGGGDDGNCLTGLEDCLLHLGISYHRVEDCIYKLKPLEF